MPVKGLLARFTIRSPYGNFDAHGIHMLAIRVTEVHAIGKLDELSKTKEFAEAAGKAIARAGDVHGQHARPSGGDDHLASLTA